jgi:hypothetical protein
MRCRAKVGRVVCIPEHTASDEASDSRGLRGPEWPRGWKSAEGNREIEEIRTALRRKSRSSRTVASIGTRQRPGSTAPLRGAEVASRLRMWSGDIGAK